MKLRKMTEKEYEENWEIKGAKKIENMWTYKNRPFFYVHESVEITIEDYEQAHVRFRQIRLGL